MSYSVSIIGSFRKPDHYNVVKKAVMYFKQAGLIVLSPKGSKVCRSIEDFVIFDTDESSLSPAEIQMVTLDKIIHSDAVYVCNVNGYVGRTTCYEIGFCLSRGIPLYFLSMPNDLPIPVSADNILSIEAFCQMVLDGQAKRLDVNGMNGIMLKSMVSIWPDLNDNKTAEISKRLMVCGSMKFYREMLMCRNTLLSQGIEAIIPKDEGDLPSKMDEKSFLQFKKRVSNAYMKKIRDSSTKAILVFNEEKKGIKNYIGANTFVEIAMAFAWNRKIYILNDIYEPFKDELLAWECKCLNGDLNILMQEWKGNSCPNQQNDNETAFTQLSLFE